jgi:hypothetical protein
MEKQTKLREWCIEQAVHINLANRDKLRAEEIIKEAKKLEGYVSGVKDATNTSRIGLAVYTQNKDGRWEASYSTSDKEEHSLVCPHCKELIDITELIKVLRG